LRAASSGLDIFCDINTGSVALISGVIGTLVTLIALAFCVGPLGHAERYLPPASQSTRHLMTPKAGPAHLRRPAASTGAAAAKPAQPAVR